MNGVSARVASDRGAGAVLVLGLVAVVASVGLTMVGAGHALVRAQQVTAAADAGALAAADVLLGWVAGDPCAVAQNVVAAHDATLAACRVEGLTVLVRAEAGILGMLVQRSARAGPPMAAQAAWSESCVWCG